MSSITNEISSAASTFTSWDSCMSKAYCKWPVIAGIIVAGLIVLSILWCIASCLCCGATLCASCVQCLTCCGCCGACKNGRRGGSRHKDDYSQMPPTPYNGYQPQPAQMMQYQQPQFAQFEGPTKAARIHEDSLPAMPSWETAPSQRIEDHTAPAQGYGHDVEMGRLGPPARTMRGGYSQLPPNAPISPMSSSNNGHFNGQRPNQLYDSDLGAQRMPMNNPAYQDYSDTPLSRAPTYATNPPQIQNQHMLNPASRTTDRFASGAISPTPQEYSQRNNQPQFPTPQQYNQFQQSQPFISQTQPASSPRHEDNDTSYHRPRSISPPILQHPALMQQQQQYSSYDPPPSQQYLHQQQEDNNGMRPPSLLQIGRKPLPGSQREV